MDRKKPQVPALRSGSTAGRDRRDDKFVQKSMTSRERSIKSQAVGMTILWGGDEKHHKQISAYVPGNFQSQESRSQADSGGRTIQTRAGTR
jgi:hypothetical protein